MIYRGDEIRGGERKDLDKRWKKSERESWNRKERGWKRFRNWSGDVNWY